MQEAVINEDFSNVDLTKIAALQQKRTLAFVNHFVVTTVQFLNNFAKQCEYKLMHFERKLEKVEAALILLETRLSSIPEVKDVVLETKKEIKTETSNQELNESVATTETTDNRLETNVIPEKPEGTDVPESPVTEPEAKQEVHPKYDRFLKMVHVGVPLQAVKLKVSIEGLDPNIFEKLVNK